MFFFTLQFFHEICLSSHMMITNQVNQGDTIQPVILYLDNSVFWLTRWCSLKQPCVMGWIFILVYYLYGFLANFSKKYWYCLLCLPNSSLLSNLPYFSRPYYILLHYHYSLLFSPFLKLLIVTIQTHPRSE